MWPRCFASFFLQDIIWRVADHNIETSGSGEDLGKLDSPIERVNTQQIGLRCVTYQGVVVGANQGIPALYVVVQIRKSTLAENV